jgi:prolyl-tRNA editing enzyme YbaK/EbsC (Cys-tRNA(Pro) deacylase)
MLMALSEIAQRLDVIPTAAHADYLPATVAAQLPTQDLIVFSVDDNASDTARFSERYGFGLEDCANTIVLRYRKGGADHFAAVVTLGSRRLDVNGAVKEVLGAQRLSFARREQAVETTGMEFGGITAFGLPDDWRILVDAAVMERPHVVMGAGVRVVKLLLPPSLLTQLPRADVAALTLPSE